MTLPSDKAAPPAHLTSRMTLTVRFCETDLMGIVHHANYLTYFEAGRVDWLHRRGVAYESWAKRGIHLPVVETRLRYRKAARFDELLVVETTCIALTRVTVNFGYVIKRGPDEARICEGETLLACVGHDLAPKRFPEEIAAIFRSPETSPSHPSAPGD
jgi:acyl-CoA thioester hydrolase